MGHGPLALLRRPFCRRTFTVILLIAMLAGFSEPAAAQFRASPLPAAPVSLGAAVPLPVLSAPAPGALRTPSLPALTALPERGPLPPEAGSPVELRPAARPASLREARPRRAPPSFRGPADPPGLQRSSASGRGLSRAPFLRRASRAAGEAARRPTASLARFFDGSFSGPARDAAPGPARAALAPTDAREPARPAKRVSVGAQAAVVSPVPAAAAGALAVLSDPASIVPAVGLIAGFASGAWAARLLARQRGLGDNAQVAASMLGGLTGAAAAGLSLHFLAALSPALAAVALAAGAAGAGVAAWRARDKKVRPRGREGLFRTFEAEDGPVLELLPGQLGKDYLLSATLERGLGEKEFYSSRPNGDRVVYFRRAGDNIQLVARNMRFRAATGTPMDRALKRSAADSVLASAAVLSESRGRVRVDLGSLFARDLEGFGAWLDEHYGTHPYEADHETSRVAWAVPGPNSLELLAEVGFASAEAGPSAYVDDARNVVLSMRYALAPLPPPGFVPRPADDRVGYFTTAWQDWSDPAAEPDRVAVTRWRLEKQDPKAERSPVKKPIVWTLENTVPHEYREAVREGFLLWNEAFERIGLVGAIEVRQQPDDAPAGPEGRPVDGASDPAEAGQSFFRWFHGADEGFAEGHVRVDPRTGEVVQGGIIFGNKILAKRELFFQYLRGLAEEPERCEAGRCGRGSGAARQAAFALARLEAAGALDEAARRDLVLAFIRDTVAHEVGHALGLRHNFAGSNWRSLDELEGSRDGLLGASVMDYLPVHVGRPGRPRGPHFQTRLGPYDFWAIEYGYKTLDGLAPAEAAAELERVASRSTEPGLAYATDEDANGLDPYVQTWSLGSDPIEYSRRQAALVRELWDRLESSPSGAEGYGRLRRGFLSGWKQYRLAVIRTARFVGGVRFHRTAPGSGLRPFEPIPAARQAEALAFLDEHLFSDRPFRFTPELLASLAPSRKDTVDRAAEELAHPPYHALVRGLRLEALRHVFGRQTLIRLLDASALASQAARPLALLELFERVETMVWREVQPRRGTGPKPRKRAISSLRRELQADYVDELINLALDKEAPRQAAALARRGLERLQKRLGSTLKTKWPVEDRAHLDALKKRIAYFLTEQYPKAEDAASEE